jgi:hypothetical protein
MRIWGIFLFQIAFLVAAAQQKNDGLPLFQHNDLLEIQIEADFKSIFKNHDDSTYYQARITFINKEKSRSKNIKIRSRGNYRRTNCSFKPLQLKFSPKKFKKTPFEGQKAVKLVSHCRSNERYNQLVVLEYLIYRTYNILTDSSFRVRLAKVDYVYAGSEKDTISKYAFFVERSRHVAKRFDGHILNLKNIHQDKTDYDHMNILAVFQYMIGNTDWSVYNNHNIKFLSVDLGDPPVPLPYDFDWCGLVAAPYAKPNPMFGVENIRERVYRGFKRTPNQIDRTIDVFLKHKKEIIDLYENCPFLDDDEKEDALNYIEDFYKILINKKIAYQEFIHDVRLK